MSAGVQKENSVRVQKEKYSKGVVCQYFGPIILWWKGRLIDSPKLAEGVMDQSHGRAPGGRDDPTAA